MKKTNPLLFIPTYNECDNVKLIYDRIKKIGIDLDMLFLDDNSPDGTGKVMDRLASQDSRVHTIHRSGKQGIGSAHQEGIRWAYRNGYQTLITMDCDFTHQPEDIPNFLAASRDFDVVVGSRYMDAKSIADWNLFRKTLTHTGHFLTKHLLEMPYDASGAFRVYRLDRIPEQIFDLVFSQSYSFFFESLYVLTLNRVKVFEVPIIMPKRAYGHSKMGVGDALASLRLLFILWFKASFERDKFIYTEPLPVDETLVKTSDEIAWDEYWNRKESKSKLLYDFIAVFYRKFIIVPILNEFMQREFKAGSNVLHAGCGSGQVDVDVVKRLRVTALDISALALGHYRRIHGNNAQQIRGSIFNIPCGDGVFDGVYNLGVMEHFTEEDISKILAEFHRVLKPGGKIVLLWPPEHGLSVTFLKGVHFILNDLMKKSIKLHPDELTRLRSKKHAKDIVARSGFSMEDYYFGTKDLFTHSVVVGRKQEAVESGDVFVENASKCQAL